MAHSEPRGLATPSRLQSRAHAIMQACGGHPDRVTLANPTPAITVAWDAANVGWYLVHARDAMRWMHQYRSRDADSLKHGYGAYRAKQRLAHVCLTFARDRLMKAEAGFARLRTEAVTGM